LLVKEDASDDAEDLDEQAYPEDRPRTHRERVGRHRDRRAFPGRLGRTRRLVHGTVRTTTPSYPRRSGRNPCGPVHRDAQVTSGPQTGEPFARGWLLLRMGATVGRSGWLVATDLGPPPPGQRSGSRPTGEAPAIELRLRR